MRDPRRLRRRASARDPPQTLQVTAFGVRDAKHANCRAADTCTSRNPAYLQRANLLPQNAADRRRQCAGERIAIQRFKLEPRQHARVALQHSHQQVCVEPRPSALNMTLPAAAAERGRLHAANIDRQLVRGARRCPLSSKPTAFRRCCRSTGQTGGRTDPTVT